jgi:hypothetical protein
MVPWPLACAAQSHDCSIALAMPCLQQQQQHEAMRCPGPWLSLRSHTLLALPWPCLACSSSSSISKLLALLQHTDITITAYLLVHCQVREVLHCGRPTLIHGTIQDKLSSQQRITNQAAALSVDEAAQQLPQPNTFVRTKQNAHAPPKLSVYCQGAANNWWCPNSSACRCQQ